MKARKHFVLLTLALVAHFEIKAQTVQWLSHYGNNALEIGLLLAADEHGQLYGTGTVGAPSLNMDGHVVTVSGDADILIVKWDSTGHAIWTRNVGARKLRWDTTISLKGFAPNSLKYRSQFTFAYFVLKSE